MGWWTGSVLRVAWLARTFPHYPIEVVIWCVFFLSPEITWECHARTHKYASTGRSHGMLIRLFRHSMFIFALADMQTRACICSGCARQVDGKTSHRFAKWPVLIVIQLTFFLCIESFSHESLMSRQCLLPSCHHLFKCLLSFIFCSFSISNWGIETLRRRCFNFCFFLAFRIFSAMGGGDRAW